jgi:hypothetical protein
VSAQARLKQARPSGTPWSAFISEHASWGYFDPGKNNYFDGYQSPPVQWYPNTPRKRDFFRLVGEITGSNPAPLTP